MLIVLFAVMFCISMVIAPVAMFRMLRAKTPRAYLQNLALFAVPMLATFGLAQLTGFIDFTAPPTNTPSSSGRPKPTFSLAQAVLMALAACVWIGGGNVLMYRHTKRMGRSFWSNFNPLKSAFREFNPREWITFALLAAVALALGALAIALGQTQ
jgi:hypothetical protein